MKNLKDLEFKFIRKSFAFNILISFGGYFIWLLAVLHIAAFFIILEPTAFIFWYIVTFSARVLLMGLLLYNLSEWTSTFENYGINYIKPMQWNPLKLFRTSYIYSIEEEFTSNEVILDLKEDAKAHDIDILCVLWKGNKLTVYVSDVTNAMFILRYG